MKRSAILKLFIGMAALLAAVSVVVVLATGSFSTVNEAGYVMPASSDVDRALTTGDGGIVKLVSVEKDDTISSTLGNFYLDSGRVGVDITYPLWTRQGAGLRFLTEETWLVSTRVELLRTYESLYLSDGRTYTEDGTQADEDEFIFLMLSNGLHINAQPAVLHTVLGDHEIPINSILCMEKDGLRWYELHGDTLRYKWANGVMDATISIGDNTYDYADLLAALGLINNAIDSGYPKSGDDKLDEADQLLNGVKNATGERKPGQAENSAANGSDTNLTEADSGKNQDSSKNQNNSASSAAPTGPSGGTNPQKPTKPGTSTDTGETTKPQSPTDPVSPSEPDEPTGPEEPVKPDEPTKPEEPTDPEEPEKPDTPVKPGDPEKPDEPIKPSDPTNPVDPTDPEEPVGPEGPAKPDNPEKPDDPTKPGDPGGNDPGESKPAPYQEPEVTVNNIEAWSYALNGQITIDDPSRTIVGGVRVAVYAKLKNGKAAGSVTEDGLPIYTAEEGRSAKLRRSFTGSREFTLATLPPDSTLYLQYTYKYIKEEDGDTIDPNTGEVQKIRKRTVFRSDFIEIKTKPLEENVSPVKVGWNVEFAASDNGMTLRNLTVANSSAYEPDVDTFENFKLNTLPYVNRIELELKDERGTTTVVRIPASTLAAAQKGAVIFNSGSPKLASNTKYTYTAKAMDRFGNVIPMDLTTSGEQVIYTARSAPTVEIETVENIVDALSLKVTIHDPDQALAKDEQGNLRPLYLTAVELGTLATGEPVVLGGTWKDQTPLAGDDANRLVLENPKDGAEYEFTLNSLAFAQAYTIGVTGSYSPQPAGVDQPRLPDVDNTILGIQRVYTAALSSGIINYDLGYYDLKDTSVTVSVQMNKKTTLGILPLVDLIRVSTVQQGQNTPDCTVELDVAQLDDPAAEWTYDTQAQALVLQEGSALTPRILLLGDESTFTGTTPWQVMQVRAVEDAETGEVQYTTAAEMRIILPEKALKTATAYEVTIQALAVKGGREYTIPTALSNPTFTTKKARPEVLFDDLFVAGDSLEFIGLRIYDPDGTVQRDGLVYADLYYGTTLLMRKTVYASMDKNALAQQLRFEGLIEGGTYTLQFVAAAYNDAEGFSSYVSNKVLCGYDVRGGSSLHGALALEDMSMVAESGETSYTAAIAVTVSDAKGYLTAADGTAAVTIRAYYSPTMNEPEFEAEPVLERVVALAKNDDGSWSVNADQARQLLENLKPDSRYRLILSAVYNNKEVLLDDISFITDGPYIIIHNSEELQTKFTNENRGANFLVVADVSINPRMFKTVSEFSGTIDFQGHKLTGSTSATGGATNLIGTLTTTGAIRNVVYEVPAGIGRPMVADNYGLMENIVIRTLGTYTIASTHQSLCCRSNAGGGVIRNLIVQLNGDMTFTYPGGGILYNNDGVLEDFYIYANNGAGVIMGEGGALVCILNGSGGVIRRGYTVLDMWLTDGGSVWCPGDRNSTLSDLYHVGDFYMYMDGKSKAELCGSRHVGDAATANNLFCISSGNYIDNNCRAQLRTVNTLRDSSWQQSVIGDNWDVENCISMGFYPRLNLSAVMQPAQEYLPLPLSGSVDIEVLSDSWASGEFAQQQNEAGNIMFRLSNPLNATITSFTIPGLEVTNILSQKVCSDGTYEVVASVKVDEVAPQYKNRYNVTGVTYTTGGRTVQKPVSYITTDISFWKPVRTAADWSAIDTNDTTRSWNYRLVNNLDLSTLSPGAVCIDGNGNNSSTGRKAAFTGNIDGDMHTIRGITLLNVRGPWVIFSVGREASVKNLVVDGMQITAGSSMLAASTSFISDSSGTLENLHFRNCTLAGGGNLSVMLGYVPEVGVIRYCSATNCSLSDNTAAYNLACGGLVASTRGVGISNCYVRDININITKTNTTAGIGGIMGYTYQPVLSVQNSYATGTITTTTGLVGGITGTDRASGAARTQNCWADVDIVASDGSVGGLSGAVWGSMTKGLAMGNITTITTKDVNRGTGYKTGNWTQANVFAHEGQVVSGIEKGAKGDAARLLSSQELASRATWVDVMGFGRSFSYEPLKRECMPKAVDSDGNELYGQEDIPIPGASGEPTLELGEAKYTVGTPGEYACSLILYHPGLTSEEMQTLYDKEELQVKLDGFDISDVTAGLASIKLSKSTAEENTSNITVTAKDVDAVLIQRKDFYDATVTYPRNGITYTLKAQVSFGHTPYWDVPDVATWNALMQSGHGRSSENFRITRKVDFQGAATKFYDLKIGRLIGAGTGEVGFYNLNYRAPQSGEPWINMIATEMRGLVFENITYDTTTSKTASVRSGFVLKAPDVEDLTIRTFTMKPGSSNNANAGFFSTVGESANITLTNCKLETDSRLSWSGVYAGSAGTINGLYAEDIRVSCGSGGGQVGGLVGSNASIKGYADGRWSTVRNITVLTLCNNIGGLGGSGASVRNTDVSDITVQGTFNIGGVAPSAEQVSDITVTNVRVTATANNSGAGICCSYMGLPQWENVLIKDSSVNAKGNVGVLGAKGSNYVGTFTNVTVLGCKITTTSGDAGGIIGRLDGNEAAARYLTTKNCVVRDTTIFTEGGGAGGLLGAAAGEATKRFQAQYCYVAEDVTVQSLSGNAGGVVGAVNNLQMDGVAVGATILTNGSNGGGFVGLFRNGVTKLPLFIKNSYFNGSVSAYNYAGGMIGRWNTTSKQADTKNYTGVMLAGSVRAESDKASLWANAPDSVGVGDMKIAVHEGMLLNGQTAAALVAADTAAGAKTQPIPKSGVLYSSADFAAEAKYTGLGLHKTNWDYTALTANFMPYPKNGEVPQYAKENAAGNAVGIPLPTGEGSAAQALTAYASDVDAVNIEGAPNASVTVNGTSVTLDENGVATLTYDFKLPLTVSDGTNSITYKADELHRTVMAFSSTWYYIASDGSIHYGTTEEKKDAPQTVALPSGVKALHLWSGSALGDNGRIYTLDENGAAEEQTDAVTPLEQRESKPFHQYTITTGSQPVTVSVYRGFTLFGEERVDYRIFTLDGLYYTVAPAQNMMYDGVSLTRWNVADGVARNFFLLGEDGKLACYSGTAKTNALGMTGISHIAHNFNTTKGWLLVAYQDGTLAGVNLETNRMLFDTRPQTRAFLAYAGNWLRGTFGGGYADSSFAESEKELADGTATVDGTSAVDGMAAADGTAQAGGANIAGGGNTSGGTSQTPGDTAASDPALSAPGDTTGEGTVLTGDAAPDPDQAEQPADEGGADGGDEETAVGATGTEPSTGADQNTQIGASDEDGTEQATSSNSVADAALTYVPGEGVLSDDVVLYDDSRVEYVAGEKLYVDGTLTYTVTSGANGGLSLTPVDDSGAGGVSLVEQVLGNKVIAYSAASGGYSVQDTAVLMAGETRPASQNDPAPDITADETQKPDGENSFQVAHGLNRKLMGSEKNGTMLLSVIIVAAVVVLLFLYGRFLRGKHRK